MPNMQQLENKNVAELEPPKTKLFYQSRREIFLFGTGLDFLFSQKYWTFLKVWIRDGAD